jgi:hypothetical protein
MRVRTLATVTTPQGEVPAGKIITIPDEVFARLAGKVEVIFDTPGQSTATARMIGNECHISYSPDLFRLHGHRDGEKVDINGVPLTLRITSF